MLETSLGVDQTSGRVEFTVTVANAGEEAVTLEFRDGKRVDVEVRADGETVWRWGEGRMFTQALATVSLAPGETVREAVAWESPPAGRYEAVATVAAANVEAGATAAFTVPPD